MTPDRTRPFITVVSGLPRSGTSMLMQMLEAGGMPVLSDGVRGADPDNPKGYLEYEPVKALPKNTAWLAQAVGSAVKVIHLLLPKLPADYQYRVLFSQREIAEVVRSQRAMLERQGKPGAALSDQQLAGVFARQLAQTEAWLQGQPHIRRLAVRHSEVIADPWAVAAGIAQFLDGGLDVAAMAQAVDPMLYRQRG